MIKKLTLLFLLLFVLPTLSYAQGYEHVNIAFKTTVPSGSTGIGGPIVQPIPGAVINVCSGSTLPMAGAICSPTTTIYSNVTLSSVLQNPTSADNSGNFFFFVPAPASYVVSVSGAGLTTYSYGLTAPLAFGGTALNANNLIGPGTITGAFSGNPTMNGNWIFNGSETFNNGIITNALTDGGLTVGNCVQAGALGILTTSSGPCGTSSGTITATGAPVAGNLTKFSGATSITNGDLSGDVTTAGTLTTTVGKVNGVSYAASPATHSLEVITAANTATAKVVPDCQDATGNHLNYTQSSDSFTCGNTAGGLVTRTGNSSSICTTGSSSLSTCDNFISWSSAFADSGYRASCSGVGPSDARAYINGTVSKIASGLTIRIGTIGAVAITYTSIECVGIHP